MVAFVRSRLTERSYCHKSSGCSCADSRGCAFRSAQSMRVLLVAVLRDPMVWWCLQQSPSQPRAPGSSSRCHHGTPSLSHRHQPSGGGHQGFASARLSPSAPKGKGRRTLGVPGTQLGAGSKGWTPAFCSHQGHTVNVKPRVTRDHHICCFFFLLLLTL